MAANPCSLTGLSIDQNCSRIAYLPVGAVALIWIAMTYASIDPISCLGTGCGYTPDTHGMPVQISRHHTRIKK
jgi:hypothetical protein